MDDLTALAATLSEGVGDARGALVLSADGLVLSAHPADAEARLKASWLRLAALGEPARGFVEFGTETWCFARRGPYAAFVVVGIGVRPGIAIDQIDTMLLAAEEARVRRETAHAPPSPPVAPAPISKPRTPLHPEPHAEPHDAEPLLVIHTDRAAADEASGTASGDAAEELAAEPEPPPSGPPAAPSAPPGDPSVWGREQGEEGPEVDRFSLAREFSKLLQEDLGDADG